MTDIQKRWLASIEKIFPSGAPQGAKWSDAIQITKILSCFCGPNINHLFLPRGGGMDIASVQLRGGMLEFIVDGGSSYQCIPERLEFEGFPANPTESFLLLTCGNMSPTGAYESLSGPYEEVVLLPNGTFEQRRVWDHGMGEDENGCAIPVPAGSRLITRFHSGKFLMVSKHSVWNRDTRTYDGRHNMMSAFQVRTHILGASRAYAP